MTRLPTVFAPHGGGPCFFMDWDPPDTWSRMATWLRAIPELEMGGARAILAVSAHWEAPAFTVNTAEHPSLLFDYHGFPEHTYRLPWPASGDPGLARRVLGLIASAGLATAEENGRGLDHGVFIPLKVAYPEAPLPVVQLSLRAGLDPGEHLALGRALAPLRDEGVLIVGTGMTFHDLRRFRFRGRGEAGTVPESVVFDAWLSAAVESSPADRDHALTFWERAPAARAAHPRAEHLLPLHVVAGAAEADRGRHAFRDTVLGTVQSAFVFGA